MLVGGGDGTLGLRLPPLAGMAAYGWSSSSSSSSDEDDDEDDEEEEDEVDDEEQDSNNSWIKGFLALVTEVRRGLNLLSNLRFGWILVNLLLFEYSE